MAGNVTISSFWHHMWRTKYFLNVYNLQCFFSFSGLRTQTLARGSATGRCWETSVPQTPPKLDPASSKNPAPPLSVCNQGDSCVTGKILQAKSQHMLTIFH